jgi:hypothetical protein
MPPHIVAELQLDLARAYARAAVRCRAQGYADAASRADAVSRAARHATLEAVEAAERVLLRRPTLRVVR